jgi:hypothetical protein
VGGESRAEEGGGIPEESIEEVKRLIGNQMLILCSDES